MGIFWLRRCNLWIFYLLSTLKQWNIASSPAAFSSKWQSSVIFSFKPEAHDRLLHHAGSHPALLCPEDVARCLEDAAHPLWFSAALHCIPKVGGNGSDCECVSSFARGSSHDLSSAAGGPYPAPVTVLAEKQVGALLGSREMHLLSMVGTLGLANCLMQWPCIFSITLISSYKVFMYLINME